LMNSGRFLYLPISEAYREALMGFVTLLFTKQGREETLPPGLRDYEIDQERDSGK